jgi:hypothetical protein
MRVKGVECDVRRWARRFIPERLRAALRRLRRVVGRHKREEELQIARRALLLSHSRMSGFDLVLVPGDPHRPDENLTSAFYDRQHEDADYRRNNWLLDQVATVKNIAPRTIVEIGCGNGRFLRAVAPYATQVIGVDWAHSPELVDLPDNVSVLRVNVVTGAVPAGDVICSADVLEHFAPRDIDAVVSKLVGAGNITSSPAMTMATPTFQFFPRPRGWRFFANTVRQRVPARSTTDDVIQRRSFASFPICR